MKRFSHIITVLMAVLLLSACEKNEPANEKILDNSVFYYLEKCPEEGFDSEYKLEFGKPYNINVTFTQQNIFYEEQEFIGSPNQRIYTYTFDGYLLVLENVDKTDIHYLTQYATYRNDTIIYMGMAFSRLLD